MKRLVLMAVLLISSINGLCQEHEEFILQNVTILNFDENGNYKKQENASIHVKFGIIFKIYSGKVPDSLSKFCKNFSKRFVLPGLIDAHVHMSLDASNKEITNEIDYENYLSGYAKSGITTIVDVSKRTSFYYDKAKDQARIFFSGPMFLGEKYKKNSDACSKSVHYCPRNKVEVNDHFKELDQKFSGNSKWKFVKIYEFDPDSKIREDIILQAKKRNLKVIEHEQKFEDRLTVLSDDNLLKPNLYAHTPPSCNDLSFGEMKAYFDLLKSYEISLITTIDVGHNLKGRMCGIDALRMAKLKSVPFILGTDSGYNYSHDASGLLKEYDYICQYLGWTEALKSVTFQSAKSLGLNKLGVIQTGYRADLLVLDTLPKSGKDLLYPCYVFKDGIEIPFNNNKCFLNYRF